MKNTFGLFLILILLCSCGEIHVEQKLDWGFNKPEAEEFYKKGMQLASENKIIESVTEFKKGLEIEPENVLLLLETGNSYKALDKLDDAETYYNKVLNVNPVHELVYPNIANLMLAKNDNVNAIKYGKIGLEKCGSDAEKAECAFNVSAGYCNIDSCDQAIKYFAQIKKFKNNNFSAYDTLLLNSINERCPNNK